MSYSIDIYIYILGVKGEYIFPVQIGLKIRIIVIYTFLAGQGDKNALTRVYPIYRTFACTACGIMYRTNLDVLEYFSRFLNSSFC